MDPPSGRGECRGVHRTERVSVIAALLATMLLATSPCGDDVCVVVAPVLAPTFAVPIAPTFNFGRG